MRKTHSAAGTDRVRVFDTDGKRHTVIDETGNRYGRLTVISFVGMTVYMKSIFLCECDCGTRKEVAGRELRSGDTVSCGCRSRDLTRQRNREHHGTQHYRFRDLTGVRQGDGGRLTALRVVDFDEKFHHARWEARCDCGNVIVVLRGNFLSGTTVSCGCVKREFCAGRAGSANPNFKHGRCVKARPAV